MEAGSGLAPHKVVLGAGRSMMTEEALAQFAAAASLPGCQRAAAMPDLHPGRGIPIGATFAMAGRVYPHLVGSDAGCGARVVATGFHQASRDRLERKLRRAFGESSALLSDLVDASPKDLFEAVWFHGPRGLLTLPGLPDFLAELCHAESEEDGLPSSGTPPVEAAGCSGVLGTIGGGNHFAELSQVDSVADVPATWALGLEQRALAVIVHSGSRGLGERLASRWGNRALEGEELAAYLGELAGACRFARTNRLLLAYRLLRALGATRLADVRGHFDIIHNDIRLEPLASGQAWVHRKGAAPAHEGSPTVVLGSRGARSWVMMGRGAEHSLRSVAHGAGRRMSRTEARSRLKERYARQALERSSLGTRVLCDDSALLYEEHPDAYKPIDPIIATLEEAGAALRVASLLPLVTVKL